MYIEYTKWTQFFVFKQKSNRNSMQFISFARAPLIRICGWRVFDGRDTREAKFFDFRHGLWFLFAFMVLSDDRFKNYGRRWKVRLAERKSFRDMHILGTLKAIIDGRSLVVN